MDSKQKQIQYYSDTAQKYDSWHVQQNDEHFLALHMLASYCEFYEISSILDVGSGTGRAVKFLHTHHPDIKTIGLEPVDALRTIGHEAGIPHEALIPGDAAELPFAEGEFDLVCEFGVLHHVPDSKVILSEMSRVAKKAIFISDVNNFGMGSVISRTMKQLIDLFYLWPVFNFVRTRGKGYMMSEGEGVFYSYSVFNDYKWIRDRFKTIHLANTSNAGANPYKTASHVGLLAVK